MDLGNIIYIIAIVAYFIYQATRKKGSQELPDEGDTPQAPPQKGMSFEDLLREIRQAQNPTAAEKPTPPKPEAVRPIPVSQPRTAVSRKPVLIEEEDDEVRHYEGAFGAKKKNPYQEFRETHSIPSTPLIKIDYDSLSSKKVNPYAELLKNPKTLKQAVVLSEILKPKYF
jgi:hypothetical protein